MAYPATLDTDDSLYVAVNLRSTALTASATDSDTSITVASTANFPSTGLLRIESPSSANVEIVHYGSKTATTFDSLTRGFDTLYPAVAHASGQSVTLAVVSQHHNALKDAIKLMQGWNGAAAPQVHAVITTTPYTALSTDVILPVDATSASATVDLPTAVGIKGRAYYIVKVDATANTVTIDPSGAQTIGGSATFVLSAQNAAAIVFSDGANWLLLSSGSTQSITPNAQTGTTYTVLTGDRAKLLTFTNAASIAVTLPQAGASFPNGWYTYVQNRGVGVVTITPTTSTVDGAATYVLRQGQGVLIASDGTNYFTERGSDTQVRLINAQTGTTYTILDSDRSKLITHSNASAIAVTLPQAGASSEFISGWFTDIENIGVGAVTITPTTSTIDGAATIVLRQGQGVRIFSDGTNYNTQRGVAVIYSLVNAQTGTSYTVLDSDRGKLVTHTNAGAIAVTLPQAGASSSFISGWFYDTQNRGAGTVTITPTTSTIDGLSSITLTTDQGIRIFSDGTNYFTQRGRSSGITWSEITGTSQTAAVNNGYIANNASLVIITLPATASLGSIIRIVGKGAGGWKIAQPANHQIRQTESSTTTTGVTGYVLSNDDFDAIEIVCTTADSIWTVLSMKGGPTFA